MSDGKTNHVFDCRENLGKGDLAGVVGELSLIADLVVEVSSTRIFQHQVETAGCLHHLIQMEHVGISEDLHAADLPGKQSLHLSVHPGLIQDLHGHFVCVQKA